MSKTVLEINNVSKQYRLGRVGSGTIAQDFQRWLDLVRGKEDPFLKVGSVNDRTQRSDNKFVWALRDISFNVKQGEVYAIIGRNGAGKSTLLKILSRVTSPTIGEIKVKGRIASLLEVGTGFHPDLTGKENIFLNGTILGMTKHEIKKNLDAIIDFSGVERYIDTPVKRYSSGMYVRLAFAVAAHLQSEILIVDEVLAVGDVEFQKKCLGKMRDVSSEGRTVLFVSHNMAAVRALCTKGVVLDQGMVKYVGTSDDAIGFYSSSMYNSAEINLEQRVDRKGNGKLRITRIEYLDKDNRQITELVSGDNYKIRMHYKKYKSISEKYLTIVVQFKNEFDEILTTIATDEQGTVFNNVPDSGYIEIEIPRLVFREGRYFLNYMISEKMAFNLPHETIDNMHSASLMQVYRGDYWSSGILNRPNGFIQESSIKICEI